MTNAEKEASEVLHSLLSVERIENKSLDNDGNKINCTNSIFTVNVNQQTEEIRENTQDNNEENNWEDIKSPDPLNVDSDSDDNEEPPVKIKKLKKTLIKQEKKNSKFDDNDNGLIKLEDSPEQVLERLNEGCECREMCFEGFNAENVYKHRLNIAELTKIEHDMYLMGVTMACLAKRNITSLKKNRVRQRAVYVYQGKKVCLDAFLYLENVTRYHLKRIRHHVMTQGVIPRVHGNMGKKPHNTFSLDMYKNVENFLKKYLKQFSSELTKHLVIYGKTRANIYNAYKHQEGNIHPDEKIMGYSTFRHFMRKQFPNVRFSPKLENQKNNILNGNNFSISPQIKLFKTKEKVKLNDRTITNNTNSEISTIGGESLQTEHPQQFISTGQLI